MTGERPLQRLHEQAGCCNTSRICSAHPELDPDCPRCAIVLTHRLCPECEQGKHGNCDGTAWDDEADQECACECFCREAQP